MRTVHGTDTKIAEDKIYIYTYAEKEEEVKKPAEKKKDTNASTGDDMNLWFALMLLSMSGMAVVFTVGKKKRNK